MQISIEITNATPEPRILREYDPDLDNIVSVLTDICEALDGANAVAFRVAGFGDDAWPVRINPDLAILLEQLPHAIAAAWERSEFDLDFYEQGVERHLRFSPRGDTFDVSCASGSRWQPEGDEAISRDAILRMLTTVRDRFLELARTIAPGSQTNPWLRTWAAAARVSGE